MIESLITRFDHLSLRERVLAVVAVIVVLIAAFNTALIGRLDLRRKSLAQELSSLQGSMTSAASAVETMNATDATSVALARQQSLQRDLESVNAQLASEAAGMIAPQRMAEVIHDMLSRQHGVVLISLRNLPARSVVGEPVAGTEPASAANGPDAGGPYVHPVELVLEGSYLDVLAYLQGLEALPWRFYWRVLDLQSGKYPVNRVRLELGTVSMTREWIGL
jgi:MSHA biogenesis protein MshJ